MDSDHWHPPSVQSQLFLNLGSLTDLCQSAAEPETQTLNPKPQPQPPKAPSTKSTPGILSATPQRPKPQNPADNPTPKL